MLLAKDETERWSMLTDGSQISTGAVLAGEHSPFVIGHPKAIFSVNFMQVLASKNREWRLIPIFPDTAVRVIILTFTQQWAFYLLGYVYTSLF